MEHCLGAWQDGLKVFGFVSSVNLIDDKMEWFDPYEFNMLNARWHFHWLSASNDQQGVGDIFVSPHPVRNLTSLEHVDASC